MKLSTIAPGIVPGDIQGLLFGYTHEYSCHMIFQFGATAANPKPNPGNFIKAIYGYVQSAEKWITKPANMLNIALTATGVGILRPDLSLSPLGPFPNQFIYGPAASSSQSSLSDLGTSAPANWLFGNNTKKPVSTYTQIPVECMVHVYGLTDEDLSALVAIVNNAAVSNGITEILPILPAKGSSSPATRLYQYQMKEEGQVHFGYLDGIDNPDLSISLATISSQQPYTDAQNLNNFLIGYGSSVSFISPAPNGTFPEAVFANNGYYNAFRMLQQDLEGFENYLESNAPGISKQINKDVDYSKEWLAAKTVGRWRNGSPLELNPDAPNPIKPPQTTFGYKDDTQGLRCPMSAHTRVANPRDMTMSVGEPPIVPRIMRVGMPYGPTRDSPDYDGQSGLIGIFLVGSYQQVFEQISFWMNTNNFSPLYPQPYPQDALLANRDIKGVSTTFDIPINVAPGTTPPASIAPPPDLPQFIVTKGSVYTIFPSLSSLQTCFT